MSGTTAEVGRGIPDPVVTESNRPGSGRRIFPRHAADLDVRVDTSPRTVGGPVRFLNYGPPGETPWAAALREAGFRVTLIASPGALLYETAAREGVEAIGLPMERKIAPLADLVSLARLWWVLMRLRPDVAEFSTPKAGLLGNIASWLAGVPARVYMLRGLKFET